MRTYLLLAGLIVLTGCPSLDGYDPVADERPPAKELVWVAKDFIGGAQCDPKNTYSPPDVERLLRRAGVPVFETEVEHYGVCGACLICPAYAAAHFALIPQDKRPTAQQLGFAEKQPPGYD